MYLLLSHSQLLSPPVSHLLYNSLPARMPASFLPTAGHPPAKNPLIACFLYLLRQNSDFPPAALDSLSFPRHMHASLFALFPLLKIPSPSALNFYLKINREKLKSYFSEPFPPSSRIHLLFLCSHRSLFIILL